MAILPAAAAHPSPPDVPMPHTVAALICRGGFGRRDREDSYGRRGCEEGCCVWKDRLCVSSTTIECARPGHASAVFLWLSHFEHRLPLGRAATATATAISTAAACAATPISNPLLAISPFRSAHAATATASAISTAASGGAMALAATGTGTGTGRRAAARLQVQVVSFLFCRVLWAQCDCAWRRSRQQIASSVPWATSVRSCVGTFLACCMQLFFACRATFTCHQAAPSLLPHPNLSTPGEPASPRERPKLVLQPRSAPAEGNGSGGDGGAAKPRSNPFGDARPVDTVAKEREIEERQKQRRAEEEASKRAAKEAAKAEAAKAEVDKEKAEKDRAEKDKADRERQRSAAKDAVAAAAAERERERPAAKAGPPPPPPPPAPAAEGASAAGGQEGGSGRGRGAKVITVPARSTGRGEGGGRGRGEGRGGGRGRGDHAAPGRGEARPGRGAGGRGEHGGRGGRGEGRGGGRGAAHGGRHHEERPAKVRHQVAQ